MFDDDDEAATDGKGNVVELPHIEDAIEGVDFDGDIRRQSEAYQRAVEGA